MKQLADEVRAAFAREFGANPALRVALAPGRVNLIGEHTDYNDGFVLPMAIDRYVAVAFAPRDDRRVRAYSPDFGERAEAVVGERQAGGEHGWFGYVAGVLWALQENGVAVRGLDLVMQGRVPIGAGLSSSAAVEMAVARAAAEAAGLGWEPAPMALAGQKAEREYVGVSCGIMDQFASAMSADGCALLLDCRSLQTELVPIPREAVVVVMDTGVRRKLTSSGYNERYAQCMQAARIIGARYPEVRALRDVSPERLAEFAGAMDAVTYRRATHVVYEIQRPRQMAEALRAGKLVSAGRLMGDSHASLRDLYEVSSPELDTIVALATRQEGCYGARLTGAGFGGCAVALVRRGREAGFIDAVTAAYRARYDHPVALFAAEPSPGAHLVDG